jgi:hypothetical protein
MPAINRIQALIAEIGNSNVSLRRAACYKCADVHDPHIVKALVAALNADSGPQYSREGDVFQSTRKAIAYALGKLGDTSATPALLRALRDDFPWEARTGRPVKRTDNPDPREILTRVFGTSVREGLQESDTDYARSVLAVAPPIGSIDQFSHKTWWEVTLSFFQGRLKRPSAVILGDSGRAQRHDKAVGTRIDRDERCAQCGRPFQSLKAGVHADGGMKDVGDTILAMKKGCHSCGVPVCFDCAADAADRKTMRGHCICPRCGSNLDSR